jgi:hypothetical protein
VSVSSSSSTGPWSNLVFRLGMSLYGVILGAVSLWLLLAEFSRTRVTTLPISPELAASAATQRNDAIWAARAGHVRGDLWAESTFTFGDLQWSASVSPQLLDEAKANATRALSLSPANYSVWLLLTDLALRFGWETPNPVEAIKMAYYSGPHEDALFPLRLLAAARLDDATDPELERLLRSDVESALMFRPNLRPAVLSAYNHGTPQARHVIQAVASQIDSAFAQNLASVSSR